MLKFFNLSSGNPSCLVVVTKHLLVDPCAKIGLVASGEDECRAVAGDAVGIDKVQGGVGRVVGAHDKIASGKKRLCVSAVTFATEFGRYFVL